MSHFAIPLFSSPDEFLNHIAAKRRIVGKGGVSVKVSQGFVQDFVFLLIALFVAPCAAQAAAASALLEEWNAGKVPFFTVPPVDTSRGAGDAVTLPDWAKVCRDHTRACMCYHSASVFRRISLWMTPPLQEKSHN